MSVPKATEAGKQIPSPIPTANLLPPNHLTPAQPLEIEQTPIVSSPSEIPAVGPAVSSEWHYDCRPQVAAVRAEVEAQGLGADWFYIEYIFSHESCIDPGRLNSSGCGGLGQACPLGKMGCGADDIPCQVRWFNNYAQAKGGWLAAYNLWVAQSWW